MFDDMIFIPGAHIVYIIIYYAEGRFRNLAI